MARRKDKKPRRAFERTVRHATPTRQLMKLTPRSALIASTLSTAAVIGTADFGPAAAAGAAAAIFAIIGGKVRGRTLGQWLALRSGQGAKPEQSALFSRDGVGVIFDGLTATALVEITPRPWQVTTVNSTGQDAAPVISADVLRRQLQRYGIGLSRIDIICAGYKFAADDRAAGVLDTLIGPVSVPLGGSTVVAVSLDLEADILGPAYQRARRKSLPDGLCQTLTIAATRVRYALAEQGFGGRLMSAQQVLNFHDTVLAQVARALAEPRWRTCGATSGVHTRTYVPARGHWNAESAASWNHLQAHRQYTTLTLTPQGEGLALAQPLITYLARGGNSLTKAESYGLRSAGGQQSAGVVRALPAATQRPLRSTGVLIDDYRQLGFGIPAGGAGLFVGSRADKTRVFVAVSAAKEPLWLSGPILFAMQMVARLSTQDQKIAVMIDEPRWEQLVAHRNTPSLTYGTVEKTPADVVVCTPQWWERNRELVAEKAVLLVTEGAPGRGATNSLTVETFNEVSRIAVSADAQTTHALWELTPIERRELLGDVDVSGTAAPRERIDLLLGEVVELPGTSAARAPRRVVAAPVVHTPGQISPDQIPPAEPRRRAAPKTDNRQPARPAPLIPTAPAKFPSGPTPSGTVEPRPARREPSQPVPPPQPETPPQAAYPGGTPEPGWKNKITQRTQDPDRKKDGRHHRPDGIGW